MKDRGKKRKRKIEKEIERKGKLEGERKRRGGEISKAMEIYEKEREEDRQR